MNLIIFEEHTASGPQALRPGTWYACPRSGNFFSRSPGVRFLPARVPSVGCRLLLRVLAPPSRRMRVETTAHASGSLRQLSRRSAPSLRASGLSEVSERGGWGVCLETAPSPSDPLLIVFPASRLVPQVPAHGWTLSALQSGARAMGLSPAAVGLLPRGPVELVESFNDRCNARLAEELNLQKKELEGMRVRQVRVLVFLSQCPRRELFVSILSHRDATILAPLTKRIYINA